MKLHPRITKTAIELVKRFEGLRRQAARLPDGGWTVGFGHTRTAREGSVVTEEEAELLLWWDLSEVATKVEAWTFTPLNDHQFQALTAFAFNIGLDNFRRSTVLKRVNEGQHLQAAAAMELWRKSEVDGEGVVVDALVRRRAAEKALYLDPPEGFPPSPTPVLRPVFDHSVIEAASQSHMAARTATVAAAVDEPEARITLAAPPAPPPAPAAAPAGEAEPQPQPQSQQEMAAEPPLLTAEPAPEALASPPEPPPAITIPVRPAVNDETGFDAPPFPESRAEAVPFGFRGFEPPPRRFGYGDPAPAPAPVPANESFGPPQHYADEAAQTGFGELSLFDRPLPAPPAVETGLHAGDEPAPGFMPPMPPKARPGLLQDRRALLNIGGLVGVALLAAAIFSVMVGRANAVQLVVGLLGVALMIPASILLLMQRTPAADDRHPLEGSLAPGEFDADGGVEPPLVEPQGVAEAGVAHETDTPQG